MKAGQKSPKAIGKQRVEARPLLKVEDEHTQEDGTSDGSAKVAKAMMMKEGGGAQMSMKKQHPVLSDTTSTKSMATVKTVSKQKAATTAGVTKTTTKGSKRKGTPGKLATPRKRETKAKTKERGKLATIAKQ